MEKIADSWHVVEGCYYASLDDADRARIRRDERLAREAERRARYLEQQQRRAS